MFLQTFHPSPVIFSLGPLQIHWYGVFIVLGIVFATLVIRYLGEKYGFDKEKLLDLVFYLILIGIIGARIYDVFLEWSYYANHLSDIFRIWQGGLAIHGGLLSGGIFFYFYAKKEKINAWQILSILVTGLALGQAIGRIGNYFNQELYGLPTDLPWGIPIDEKYRIFGFENYSYFHPTFLYEAILNLFLFGILFLAHKMIFKKIPFDKQNDSGVYIFVVMIYLIVYSITRFILEFVRIDTTPLIFSWRFPQLVSILIIFISIIFLLIKRSKKKALAKF